MGRKAELAESAKKDGLRGYFVCLGVSGGLCHADHPFFNLFGNRIEYRQDREKVKIGDGYPLKIYLLLNLASRAGKTTESQKRRPGRSQTAL